MNVQSALIAIAGIRQALEFVVKQAQIANLQDDLTDEELAVIQAAAGEVDDAWDARIEQIRQALADGEAMED